jgi:hypothetical protein
MSAKLKVDESLSSPIYMLWKRQNNSSLLTSPDGHATSSLAPTASASSEAPTSSASSEVQAAAASSSAPTTSVTSKGKVFTAQ